MEEMNKIADGLNKSIADIQTKHEEAIKALGVEKAKESGEHKETVNKMTQDFDAKMSKLEAVINRKNVADETIKDTTFEYNKKYFNSVADLSPDRRSELKDLANSKEAQISLKSAFGKYLKYPKENFNSMLTPEEQKSFNTIIDPQGGYFVRPEFMNSIIEKRFDAHQIHDVVEKRTIGASEISEVADWNDYDDAEYVNELANAPAVVTDANYEQVTWNVKEVLYPKQFTRNSLEDSFLDVESYVMGKMREGIVRKDAALMLAGNGTDKPRGLLTYADGASARDKIEQITSTNVASMAWEDVITLLPSALRGAYHGNASFLMRRQSFYELLSDVDGMGKFQIGNQIQFLSTEKVIMSILGFPVKWEGFMEAGNVTAGKAVLFGDFEAAYRLVTKAGVSLIRNDTDARHITLTQRERKDGKLKDGNALKMLVIK